MILSTRRLLSTGPVRSGGTLSGRRPTKIVIPSVPGSSPSATSAPRSNYSPGGSLNTQRFITNANRSTSDDVSGERSAPVGRKKLYEDTPYVSSTTRDRWSGKGPTILSERSLADAHPVIGSRKGPRHVGIPAESIHYDPNESSDTFGKLAGSPTQDATSPGEEVARTVGGTEAEFVRQRRERQRFLNAVDEQHEQVWRDSKSHLRATERAMAIHGGIEGAISERLAPKMPSASSEIRSRPLDKRILEEIYKDLHGLRSEQSLKKNLGYERWVTKVDKNAPVMAASRRAQETFGFGGTAQLVKQATTREQFPVTPIPEVAFLGRTNSGRSSLINALLNSYVCRYGHLKGTTKTADFVNVADKLMLVDLPGYGYFHPFSSDPLRVKQGQALNEAYIAACASSPVVNGNNKGSVNPKSDHLAGVRKENKVGTSAQNKTTRVLLDGRQRNIKRIFICVPCVTGLQDGDLSLCAMLEDRQIPFSILLTKTDLMPIRKLARMADLTRSKVAKYTCCEELMMVNALRLAGITRIQNMLGNIARRDALTTDPLEMNFDTIV